MGKGNLKAVIAGISCGILGIVFAINQATSLNEPVAIYSPPPVHHHPRPGHSLTPTPFETFSTPQGSYRPPVISMPAGGSHRPARSSSEPTSPHPRPTHRPVPKPSPKPTPTPIQVPVLPGLVCKTLGGVQIGDGGHLLVCHQDGAGLTTWTIL